MSTVQFIVGLLCLGVGGGMMLMRDGIVARQVRSIGRSSMQASGVAVVGAVLCLVGALQIVLAFS